MTAESVQQSIARSAFAITMSPRRIVYIVGIREFCNATKLAHCDVVLNSAEVRVVAAVLITCEDFVLLLCEGNEVVGFRTCWVKGLSTKTGGLNQQ